MSKINVNTWEPESGTAATLMASGDTVTVPSGATLAVASGATITNSGTATGFGDTAVLEDDVALLGFKVAVNGSLAKYNLVDQTEDAFMDATGIDASSSTNEIRSGSNYYTGTTATPTGGTVATYTDSGTNYRAHTFLADGTFTVIAGTISADYFMVAGGGGGGNAGANTGPWGAGGGGGAGGFLTDTGVSLVSQAYTITAGDGGDGGGFQVAAANGTNGENSSIVPVSGTSYIAIGGGAGANSYGTSVGLAGGSGGGGAYQTRASGAGTAGPPRQGYDGGTNTYTNSGAGGGGAGGAGGAAAAGDSPGGTGVSNNYRDGTSGTTVGTHYFGGGGGGGGYNATGGTATYGGGAAGVKGGTVDGTSNGSAGTAVSGGGGGGGSNSSAGAADKGGAGGDGGKGVVVIRYEDVGFAANNMTLVSNATTANDGAPTKGDIVMTYTNGTGTATLNTDLTAEFSADNGSNWTSTTLVAQGTTGTASPHFIVSAHNVTLTSASGTAMRYRIKTLNQSGSKETRIQAVSLGWS